MPEVENPALNLEKTARLTCAQGSRTLIRVQNIQSHRLPPSITIWSLQGRRFRSIRPKGQAAMCGRLTSARANSYGPSIPFLGKEKWDTKDGICVRPRPAYREAAISGGRTPGSKERCPGRSCVAHTTFSGQTSASCSTVFQRRGHQHRHTGIQPLLCSTVSFSRERRNVHALWSQSDIGGTGHIGWGELVWSFF